MIHQGTGKNIIRIFPRRTRATPTDESAFVGMPPLWVDGKDLDEVHVSCAFTWDKAVARDLAREAAFRFPRASVKLGGPALGDAGGEFTPGLYLAPGYTITSRGCPNRCGLCMVPGREGPLRLLEIKPGWNVLDNNLLACPRGHVLEVLEMLRHQPHRPLFTGGLEARLMTPEYAEAIVAVRPERIFLAYDRLGELGHVRRAVAMLRKASSWRRGAARHHISCYVLVGYPGDSVADAEKRVQDVIRMNVRAYPMYYRDESYSRRPAEWHDLIGGVMAMGGRR
jgi:hypothetical protein